MDTDLYKIMEQQTGWSRELLYQLVDNVKDYAIFVSDLDGRIISWNIGAEHIFGFPAEEAIGQLAHIIFTPEDRANRIPEKEMETARQKGRAEDERWHVRKDGSRFFASGVQTPLYDKTGSHTGYAKIARDLTERVKYEEELQSANNNLEINVRQRTKQLNDLNELLRREISERKESENIRVGLLRKIVRTQEDERKRIARDIHDHIGQEMTGLKYKFYHLLQRYQKDLELTGELKDIQSITDKIDSEVDFLIWELRPAVLDDLGLPTAIKSFVNEWSSHFQVKGDFHQSGLDKPLLPEIEINLYRIVQEALNNTCKHAKASQASVLLEKRNSHVVLIIEDDGIGFDPAKKAVFTGNDRGMGLYGMKERAELVGGGIEIESSPGRGTTVYVRVPAVFEESKT